MKTTLKKSICRVVLGSVVACALVSPPLATRADGPSTRPVRRAFTWTPPTDGAPSNLSSATARGCEKDPNLAASVLAPNSYVGVTTQESPTLYWYTTKPTTMKIRVTMVRDRDLKDTGYLFNLVYRDPLAAGIQSLDLSRPLPVMDSFNKVVGEPHAIKLEENVKYHWSVHLVAEDGGSQDVVSEAVIQRVKPSPELAASLSAAAGDEYEKANAYARAHVWYDMLASLSTLIEQNPGDALLRAQRAKLLKSEDLPKMPSKELADWANPPGK